MSRRPVVIVLAVVVVAVVVIGAVALLRGSGGSSSSVSGGPIGAILAKAAPAQAPFEGLTEVKVAIGDDRCLRLAVADSLAERVAGLRGNSADFGPYDGMLFVFDGPTESGFTMSDVTDPLDIAFFDQDGSRNSTRSMKACPDKAENACPVYQADGPYVYAVETKPGGLPSGSISACSPS